MESVRVRPARNTGTVVYLIDDDDAVRDSLKLLLESHGLTVLDYGSASEFLSRYTGEREGCLVVDLHLPVTSGLDLTKRLAAMSAEIPVVLITGRADNATKARAFETGVAAFLEKPFPERALLEAIDAALLRPRAGNAAAVQASYR
jgi:FixJ family two-component response regulator